MEAHLRAVLRWFVRPARPPAGCSRGRTVALERLTYDRSAKAVSDRSDTSEGQTAGTETADPPEVLARVLVHMPGKGRMTTRDSGCYANRPRGMRGRRRSQQFAAPYF